MILIVLIRITTILLNTALFLIKKNISLIIEWKILVSSTLPRLKILIFIDSKSCLFSATVLIITSRIITYTQFYINYKKIIFTKTICIFVASIIIVIISPRFISLIIGWEGLGITSFALIIFYINKKSITRRIYTIMINRVGDIALILRIIIIINLSTWFIFSINPRNAEIIILLCMRAFSKRAQIPFSAWLTEAIAAPTPVSALVHSSTLVTAGVYLIIRLEINLKFTSTNKFIFTIRTITLLMASLNSLIQWDIKKIVALSTLSQLRIMFISISINMYRIAYFHILTHATFKALIFLCRRTLIRTSNRQDLRKITRTSLNSTISIISFNIANLTLCGFPFTAGFYSKEIIMEMIRRSTIRTFIHHLFIICILATMIYTIKIMNITNISTLSLPIKPLTETKRQKIRKIMLLAPSILLGNKMNWIININYSIRILTTSQKIIPVVIIIIRLIVANKIKKLHNSQMTYKIIINHMWFSKSLSINAKISIITLIALINKTVEKSIIVYIQKLLIISIKTLRAQTFKTTHVKFRFTSISLAVITLIFIYLNSLKLLKHNIEAIIIQVICFKCGF